MKERIIRMFYQPEELKFETDDEAREFYHALGRMAVYGLNGDPEGLSIINMVVDKRKEITCAYYPSRKRADYGTYSENKIFHDLDAAFTPFTNNELGHVFVMGAVPRAATETDKFRYSFHS